MGLLALRLCSSAISCVCGNVCVWSVEVCVCMHVCMHFLDDLAGRVQYADQ